MRAALHLVLGIAALAAGCGGGPSTTSGPAGPDTVQVARARAAADALGRDLITMLSAELARGGPEGAIAVCADSAQQRTQQHQREGIAVRRVGTRVRNPLNAPDSLESAVLATFAADLAAGRLGADSVLVIPAADGGSELRYFRPIRVQEMCLACHGPVDQLSPAVRKVIAERYPEDRATGYAAGDLRGLISVRLAAAPR